MLLPMPEFVCLDRTSANGSASPEEAGPKAMEAAMKALELDSTRAEVHYTLALMNMGMLWIGIQLIQK